MRRDPHVSQPLALKIGVQPAHVPLVDRIDQARHLTDRPIRCLAQCANGLHRLHVSSVLGFMLVAPQLRFGVPERQTCQDSRTRFRPCRQQRERRTAPAVTIFYLGLTSAGIRYATSVAGEAFDKLAVGDEVEITRLKHLGL